MSHRVLLEYIHAAKELGAEDAQIIARLASAGWYHVDIQDAIGLHRKMTVLTPKATGISAPAPMMPPTPEPLQTYNPRIIAVAALSFALALIAFFAFFG